MPICEIQAVPLSWREKYKSCQLNQLRLSGCDTQTDSVCALGDIGAKLQEGVSTIPAIKGCFRKQLEEAHQPVWRYLRAGLAPLRI